MSSCPSDSLTIVIPALNEEEAIGGTIERCLAAQARIQALASLEFVEFIVVSDGSTDRTAEIARSFGEVKVIVFEQNRGYGAAIKEGWRQGRGTLLAFLDADGTCDPEVFADMCLVAKNELADVVLGTRMGPYSKMPAIRRLGNRIFAFLLGLLCGRQVTDTASGMRVIRRDSLKWLNPLPDGLHFTPAMSSKALFNDLRIVELPMSYEERIGRSKLSVVRDGIRFLQCILSGLITYRPEKVLLSTCFGSLCGLSLLAAHPVEFYLRDGRLEEWMIYRFAVCHLLGLTSLMLLLATALTYEMSRFGPRRGSANDFWPFLVASIMRGRVLAGVWSVLAIATLGFLWPGIWEFATTSHVTLHWSRLLAGSFSLFSCVMTAVFYLLIQVVRRWQQDSTRLAASGRQMAEPTPARQAAPPREVAPARDAILPQEATC